MRTELLRFDGAAKRDPAIESWLNNQQNELGTIARYKFEQMRACGDEVLEVFHDNAANACLGDFPFAYVAIFSGYVNLGFFQGASLPDPSRLLQGAGKRMRHVTLKPGETIHEQLIDRLIAAAYEDMKARVEHG